MKKIFAFVLALTAIMSLATPVFATGNGAPSGNHFTLNIIATDNIKNLNMDQGAGNTIFVKLGATGEGLDQQDTHGPHRSAARPLVAVHTATRRSGQSA